MPLQRAAVRPALGGLETIHAHGNTSTTETIDLAQGNVHTATLDANCTFTFTGATNGKSCSFTLRLTQDGTGSRTATWPASVAWPGASTPTLATAAASVDEFVFETGDGGTTWFGHHITRTAVAAIATDTLWDAKGDLAGGTGANTAARLAVGSNGQVLTADSAATTGMKWAAAGSGADFGTQAAAVATEETTTSTSYTDLTTTGPSVTVTIGASGKAKVTASAQLSNSTANTYSGVGVVISGANTVAATTYMLDSGAANAPHAFSRTKVLTGLSTGATTFKLQYIAEAGTAKFAVREIIVEPVL